MDESADGQTVLVGVTSFGSVQCSDVTGLPAVCHSCYHVTEILDWIKNVQHWLKSTNFGLTLK
jgi:hypothetical protein